VNRNNDPAKMGEEDADDARRASHPNGHMQKGTAVTASTTHPHSGSHWSDEGWKGGVRDVWVKVTLPC
jgi:hypothetical protein